MKKTRLPNRYLRSDKQGKKGFPSTLILTIAMLSFMGIGCQKDNNVVPDFSTDVNTFIMNMPVVQFPAEQAPQLDSTVTEQDPEYDYTIKYYSAAAGYDEQIVLNPQTDVIYPGALIKGGSILDGSYVPVSVKRKPITISTSLQGADSVSVEVENPNKLSAVREAVNSLMNQEYDVPPANLGFTMEDIYSREQMDMALHVSYQSGSTDLSGSFDYSDTKIRTRVVAKFIQSYYTLDLDLPSQPSDLIDQEPSAGDYGSYMPMYVSTVTFGRMALFTVESELSQNEVHTYLQAAYNHVDGDASADFESLSAKSTIKVYVLGGSGADASTTINGFQDFKKYITEGGNFSKTSPGAPISYKLRFIDDNSIAKVVTAASYPIRTAVPRTDNIRYDISVRLVSMQPLFEDSWLDPTNEFYGTISSWVNTNSSVWYKNWNIASGGNTLKIDQNQIYNFTSSTTTRREFYTVKGDDKMVIRIKIYEDDPIDDDYLGQSTYEVPVSDIVSRGTYTYRIYNYGAGSQFMNLVFELKVEATTRV